MNVEKYDDGDVPDNIYLCRNDIKQLLLYNENVIQYKMIIMLK